MNNAELYKKMRKLNELLSDFLDNMDIDEAEEESSGKKKDKKEED